MCKKTTLFAVSILIISSLAGIFLVDMMEADDDNVTIIIPVNGKIGDQNSIVTGVMFDQGGLRDEILPVHNLDTGENFSTLQEAIDDSDTLDDHTIIVDPGVYNETVNVSKAVTIKSTTGPANCIVNGSFLASVYSDTIPVTIIGFNCTNVYTYVNNSNFSVSRAPIIVRNCSLEMVEDTTAIAQEKHFYILENGTVNGNVNLSHVICNATITVRNCPIGGDVAMNSVISNASRIVKDCQIGGNVAMNSKISNEPSIVQNCQIAGNVDVKGVNVKNMSMVIGNTVGGSIDVTAKVCLERIVSHNIVGGNIYVTSTSCTESIISNNTLTDGNISAKSTACRNLTISNNTLINGNISARYISCKNNMSIENNTQMNGVINVTYISSIAVIRNNKLTCLTEVTGINVKSIIGPTIDNNSVNIPYVSPTGDPLQDDSLVICAIQVVTTAGKNITNNKLNGGTFGIYYKSKTGSAFGNVINNTHFGIYGIQKISDYSNNIITNCTGYGIYCKSNASLIFGNHINNTTVGMYANHYLSEYKNNTITDCNGDGMILNCSGIFSGNIVKNNGGTGFRIINSSYIALQGNTASGNGEYDFYSDENSPKNIVTNLTISSYPTTVSFTYDNGIALKGVETPPADPSGKSNIGKYINVTNITGNSWIFLDVSYTETDLGTVDENTLKMWKHNETGWTEIPPPNGVNTVENYVYANITSFGIFAPLAIVTQGDAPVISDEDPGNGSTDVERPPSELNATVEDPNDDTMDVFIRWKKHDYYHFGEWVTLESYTDVGNGTYDFIFYSFCFK